MWAGLRTSSALALLLAGCSEPAPVEVDGDQIRALVAEVARGTADAERELSSLAARSPDAKSLAFRETDRALRTARMRLDEARETERELSGRALTQAEQERLRMALVQRADAEAQTARLEPMRERLR